jgi:hypothetical protein
VVNSDEPDNSLTRRFNWLPIVAPKAADQTIPEDTSFLSEPTGFCTGARSLSFGAER